MKPRCASGVTHVARYGLGLQRMHARANVILRDVAIRVVDEWPRSAACLVPQARVVGLWVTAPVNDVRKPSRPARCHGDCIAVVRRVQGFHPQVALVCFAGPELTF